MAVKNATSMLLYSIELIVHLNQKLLTLRVRKFDFFVAVLQPVKIIQGTFVEGYCDGSHFVWTKWSANQL